MSDREEKDSKEKHLKELLRIMKHVFFSIVRVDLLKDTAYILQSVDRPKCVGQEFSWAEYLENYSRFVDKKVLEQLMSRQLLKQYQAGNTSFSKDICFMKKQLREWLSIEVFMEPEEEKPYATLIVKKSTKEHLQKSIIEQYVYSKCDHFACLDARNNSFETFGGMADGEAVPVGKYENYSTEVMKYVKKHVIPEERVKVIHQMSLSCIQQELEHKDAHIFTFGIMDPVRGYVRKQLEYRYYDKTTEMILLSRSDITNSYMESKEKETELMSALKRACTDSLTGLLNHQGTIDEVSLYLGQEEEMSALMFIDMDNFKDVNDSLGHITGDKLLRKTAKILRKGVRSDDLVGRVGGDEFLVFLRKINAAGEAKECAERLCRSIRRLSVDFGFPISCSIGVAVSPEDGADYTTLTESADKRVYAAKSRGKNQISIG